MSFKLLILILLIYLLSAYGVAISILNSGVVSHCRASDRRREERVKTTVAVERRDVRSARPFCFGVRQVVRATMLYNAPKWARQKSAAGC